MSELTDKIRETALDLLKKQGVDLIIGFADGTLPMRSSPWFARQESEVERLTWNSFCENNLAQYLPKRKGKFGIVAKGCDVRAVVELIKENQIFREQVVIIGLPCSGMIDRKQVETKFEGKEITEVAEKNGSLVIKGDDFEESLNTADYLYACCRACTLKNPTVYDVLIGNPVEETSSDPFTDVEQFEALPPAERWAHLTAEFSKCIRCYACRNACPLCYCKECFVDCSQPQWIGKTTEASDTAIFHIMRAFHLAGRCLECGACERACPVVVDIRKLNRKLVKDVKNLFDYQAGLNLEELAPLATYKPDDPEQFILNP
ncbi:Coenzyme F420 hydrogenase/dehydrogenase, beta subunit C-terminal domain [Chloroflexota bacterium]